MGQPCNGPLSQSCGHCGTQTRTCDNGVLSPWQDCTGETPVPPGGAPGGFTFDGGTNQGWTIDGIYNASTGARLDTVSGPTGWDDFNQVPKAVNTDPSGDNIGAARVIASFMGFGFASQWRMDAITPDLADTSPFQNHSDVSFSVLNKFAGGSVITQALFEVEKCDGATSFFREVDSGGNAVFCTTTPNTWTTCHFHITVNNTNRIKKLHLRFFFQAGVPFEGFVDVDGVTAQ
jgi:hypothetical protein